jgi:hypothetical protein
MKGQEVTGCPDLGHDCFINYSSFYARIPDCFNGSQRGWKDNIAGCAGK